jgi:hypothetical protein
MPDEKNEEIDPIEAIRRRNLERAKRLKEILKFGDFGLGATEIETEEETTEDFETDALIDKIMSEEAEVPTTPQVEEKVPISEPTEEFEELDLASFAPSFWEEEEAEVPPPPIPEIKELVEEKVEEEVIVSEKKPALEIPEITPIKEEVVVEKKIAEIPTIERAVPVEVELPETVEAKTPEEVKAEEAIQIMIEVSGNNVHIGRRNITLSDTIELLENIIQRYKEMKAK